MSVFGLGGVLNYCRCCSMVYRPFTETGSPAPTSLGVPEATAATAASAKHVARFNPRTPPPQRQRLQWRRQHPMAGAEVQIEIEKRVWGNSLSFRCAPRPRMACSRSAPWSGRCVRPTVVAFIRGGGGGGGTVMAGLGLLLCWGCGYNICCLWFPMTLVPMFVRHRQIVSHSFLTRTMCDGSAWA